MVGGKPTRGCCAICFDDGYEEFRQHALPVLLRHSFPVTHFLVADCVEDGTPPWTYRMNRLSIAFGWSSREAKASQQLVGGKDACARAAWLAERERAMPPEMLLPRMLRAKDIRAIDSHLVEWGSHTASHGFLDRLSDEEVEREVCTSKHRLEALTGTPIRLLAYPNGYYDDRVQRAARRADYAAALTVQGACVGRSSPPFAIPRFDVGGHPSRMLALEVTGALGALRRLRR